MSAGITPGPWSFSTNPGDFAFEHVVGADGTIVARPLKTNVAGQYAANARAIAEVPAMVATLRDLLTAHDNPTEPFTDELRQLAIRDARSVLARIDKET